MKNRKDQLANHSDEQIHRILEINQLNTITVDVVEAAIDSLVMGI